jgi:acetyltransferase-like isoleucine patch superfamily enzyme
MEMGEPKRSLQRVAEKETRPFIDPSSSDRGGAAGFAETLLRRFKTLAQIVLMTPLYLVGCLVAGAAGAPAVMVYNWLMEITSSWPAWGHAFAVGFGAAAAFFTFGFTLVFILPIVNFVLMAKLKPWRGPYYSLEAIRWFIHNGITYGARYTILEFITPSPLGILFYKWMGMKIGRGSAINSTWISDPSLIEIGKRVTIGGSACLIGHYGQGGYLVLAPVKIGDGATIGLRATIMGGVEVGENAKVMPHSVVLPKTIIPAGETWGGVPAAKIEKTEK